MQTTLYTIGHGNKTLEVFLEELRTFDIHYLIDVRSKPYSKYNPQYNKKSFEAVLKRENVKYVFLGKQLGGIPDDPSCYTNDKVDYEKVKEKDIFKEGLARLLIAHEKKIKVAMMCSEGMPQYCHRTKLIGRELMKKGICINHILSKEKIKDQKTVLFELTKGFGEFDLFGNSIL